ncbi:MAG: von Willebrand factor type A domain-containing protein [Candidatus Azobacteroides sp.]|nr:von Willebrand factor type A domain-containing protein [Candidatus Azobacteroides sp.]
METKKLHLGKLFFFLMLSIGGTFQLDAQKITVSGKVTDADTGERLIGCVIIEKGSTNGMVSDFDGKYSITVREGATLVFSYIGYETQEIKVKGTVHHVQLRPDVAHLQESIVISYGVNEKRELSYSVSDQEVSTHYYIPSTPHFAPDTEEYGSYQENRFKLALEEPLSTFSADVDMASYSNIRRFINNGQKPRSDAVRVEEMINYFSYSYPVPKGDTPVNIITEIGVCPWNRQHNLVRIGLKAKEIADENLPASNLVFLIDVSGSMYGPTRLDLVKSSLKLLVNNLRSKDQVSIVVYAGAAGLVLPPTFGNDKQKIRESLDALTAGGSTAGGAGIKLAYKIAKENFIKNGNNRIILCTDGDFNVGVSSNDGLEKLIEEERRSGIFLTILGYGMGNYKDSKMQILSQKGNGNHAYIDNLQEANKVLVNEFGGTMYTVAKDVKLQVEFNPALVQAYRLVGYESRLLNKEDFNDDTKDAGEMGAGHTVTAFYEIIPVGMKSNILGNVDDLKYQKRNNNPEKNVQFTDSSELLTIKMRYKEPTEDVSKKIEVPVVNRGATINTEDFYFSAAVAMFGQLLKESDFKGNSDFQQIIDLAEKGVGADREGYRREFIRLVKTVKGLTD